MKPIYWLLDFDGVLNASKPGWSAPPHSGWAYANERSWRIRWSPRAVSKIHELNRLDHLHILWCSTWCGRTDQLERLLRLPNLGSVSSTEAGFGTKLRAAQKVLADGHRLIWTDDEAIPYEWYTSEEKLIIRPKPSKGLRPEHFEEIERFVMQ